MIKLIETLRHNTQNRFTIIPEKINNNIEIGSRIFDYYTIKLIKNENEIDFRSMSPKLKILMDDYISFRGQSLYKDIYNEYTNISLPIFSSDSGIITNYDYLFDFFVDENGDNTATIEYENKIKLINRYKDLFPTLNNQVYCTNIYRGGFHSLCSLDDDLYLTLENERISAPIIKVENAEPGLNLYIILRGMPIPMRKTITSEGNNFIFSYPEYLLNDKRRLESIEGIIFSEKNENMKIFIGAKHAFGSKKTITDGYGTVLKNLNIIIPNQNYIIKKEE